MKKCKHKPSTIENAMGGGARMCVDFNEKNSENKPSTIENAMGEERIRVLISMKKIVKIYPQPLRMQWEKQ